MKTAFSSVACPEWDLQTMADKAVEYGYEGVELRGLGGKLELTDAEELTANPAAVKALFSERNLQIVSLATSATLDMKSDKQAGAARAQIEDLIALAAQLGCRRVRMFAGEIQKLDNEQHALSRMATRIRELMPAATRAGVTVLVENSGDFLSANHMWYLSDAVAHPNVAVCWNQCNAMALRERATYSVPRLGRRIGMVHLTDADFDADGVLMQYRSLGQGNVGIERMLWILRGLIYTGWLVFEWPRLWIDNLSGPDTSLPEAAAFLKQFLAARQDVLAAYKGDKNAAKFAAV